MKWHKLTSTILLLSSITLMGQSAHAEAKFVGPLNSALGTTGLSCSACHNGPASNGASATFPMATTYNIGSSSFNIANSDSDGDGFTNKQEANRTSTAFNIKETTPFTLAKARESSNSNKVVVTGGVATETTIATDPYAETGITLTGTNEVAGLVAAQVTTASATLTFAKPIVAGSKAYAVDLATKTNTALTDITYNKNGSITIAGIAAPTDIVVERVLTRYNTGVAGRDDDDDDGGGGCLTTASTIPWTMLMTMFVVGLLARRKHNE